jgi:hypothetical protein
MDRMEQNPNILRSAKTPSLAVRAAVASCASIALRVVDADAEQKINEQKVSTPYIIGLRHADENWPLRT